MKAASARAPASPAPRSRHRTASEFGGGIRGEGRDSLWAPLTSPERLPSPANVQPDSVGVTTIRPMPRVRIAARVCAVSFALMTGPRQRSHSAFFASERSKSACSRSRGSGSARRTRSASSSACRVFNRLLTAAPFSIWSSSFSIADSSRCSSRTRFFRSSTDTDCSSRQRAVRSVSKVQSTSGSSITACRDSSTAASSLGSGTPRLFEQA